MVLSALDQKTILLVEDEALIGMSEKTDLETFGYRVRHVLSGKTAVDAVLSESETIDLVLMDIDLGNGMDGTETARAILEERDIPVIFLSSHTEPDVVARTEEITSYGYVVKDSGIIVLDASIKMAFRLFEAKKREQETTRQLRESELRYRTIYETVGVGIAEVSLEGIIFKCNRAYAGMFGYTPEEMQGKHISFMTHPDFDYAGTQENLQRRLVSGQIDSFNIMKMFLHRDGYTVWGQLNANLIRDEEGRPKYLLGSILDITASRES